MVLDRGHAPEASNEIANWTPADRDEVLAFIVGIQRDELGVAITAEDQPDLVDVPGVYEAFWVARAGGAVVGTIAGIRIAPDAVALRKMFVRASSAAAPGSRGA